MSYVIKVSDKTYEQLKKIQATLPASPALVNIVKEAIEDYFKKISGGAK